MSGQHSAPEQPFPPDPLIDEIRAARARLAEQHGHDLRALARAANDAARQAGQAPVIPEPSPADRKQRGA